MTAFAGTARKADAGCTFRRSNGQITGITTCLLIPLIWPLTPG